MKYLRGFKLFEINNDEINNDFYTMITSSEYKKLIGIEYDDNPYDFFGKLRNILHGVKYTSVDTENNSISFERGVLKPHIKLIKDEWFIVRFNEPLGQLYFKCDQFEGLIKLLKDFGFDLRDSVVESKKDSPKVKKSEIDGFLVYQGRDAQSNEYVTFELSDPEDYWFHAKGVPGSHIIIKVKNNIPTEQTIKKVAQIAAKNSKSDKEEVLVVYCKKKFVTKKEGSAVGKVEVDYKNSHEIIVPKN